MALFFLNLQTRPNGKMAEIVGTNPRFTHYKSPYGKVMNLFVKLYTNLDCFSIWEHTMPRTALKSINTDFRRSLGLLIGRLCLRIYNWITSDRM